jgi:hypothetical protein
MRIYWSLNSIPELNNKSPETQQQLWRSCFNKVNGLLSLLLSFLVVGLFGGSFSYLAMALGENLQATHSNKLIIVCIGSVIGAGLGGFVYGQILTHLTRSYLREELKKL